MNEEVIAFLEREKDIAESDDCEDRKSFIDHIDYLLSIARDPASNGVLPGNVEAPAPIAPSGFAGLTCCSGFYNHRTDCVNYRG